MGSRTHDTRFQPDRFASFDEACRHVPRPLVERLFQDSTRGLSVALCLHRISETVRPTDPLPELTVSPTALDEFLGIAFDARNPLPLPKVTITFDDGYLDGVEYVDRRAPDLPGAEWVIFVCPDKLTRRSGFRWDLLETREPPERARRMMVRYLDDGLDVLRENERPELRGLADREPFRQATVAQIASLTRHPSVVLGNHTDNHFRTTRLGSAAASDELDRSQARFEALFGPPTQFAFPFGVPRRDFEDAHTGQLRRHRPMILWSTEPRLYAPEERVPGAVLPRIPVLGGWHPHTIAIWISRLALRRRAVRLEAGLRRSLGRRSATLRSLLGL